MTASTKPGDDLSAPGSPLEPRRLPWWRIPLYPLALPIGFVLVVWAPLQIHPATLYRPLVASFVLAVLLTLVLSAIARSRDLGGLATVALMLAVVTQPSPLVAWLLLAIAVLFVVLGLSRRGVPWPVAQRISRGMTLVGLIVALTVGISVVQSGAPVRAVDELVSDLAAAQHERQDALADAPDIYMIMLDGYPGAAAQALLPEHPGTTLRQDLVARGFHADVVSHSNYLQTVSTLTSMFQMQHLSEIDGLGRPWGPPEADARRLRSILNSSNGIAHLRALGYDVFAQASGFAEVELRRVDRLIESPQPTEFEIALIRGSGLGYLVETVAPDLFSGLQRDRVRSSFSDLRSLAREPSSRPRFVFDHVIAPHPPYVFGPDGEPRRDNLFTFFVDFARDRREDRQEMLRRHLDQAVHTDRLVLETVDALIADAVDPPVIVVFSDHGPGTGFETKAPLSSDLVERTSNILAVYAPGKGDEFEPPRTPVNILPAILNHYFGAELPFRDDSVWAWGDSRLDLIRQPQLED